MEAFLNLAELFTRTCRQEEGILRGSVFSGLFLVFKSLLNENDMIGRCFMISIPYQYLVSDSKQFIAYLCLAGLMY